MINSNYLKSKYKNDWYNSICGFCLYMLCNLHLRHIKNNRKGENIIEKLKPLL